MIACPMCNSHSVVIETRRTGDNQARRRRRCQSCGQKFSTVELLVATGRPQRTGSTSTIPRRDLELISRIVTHALKTGRDPTHG